MLQASASEVYGDPEVHPQPETYRGQVNPVGPRSGRDVAMRQGAPRMPAGMPDLSAMPPSLRELPPGLGGMDQLPPGFDPSKLKFPKST